MLWYIARVAAAAATRTQTHTRRHADTVGRSPSVIIRSNVVCRVSPPSPVAGSCARVYRRFRVLCVCVGLVYLVFIAAIFFRPTPTYRFPGQARRRAECRWPFDVAPAAATAATGTRRRRARPEEHVASAAVHTEPVDTGLERASGQRQQAVLLQVSGRPPEF